MVLDYHSPCQFLVHSTTVVRRDYLHFIKKYNRFEKRHKNISAHLSPAFRDVALGDKVTIGQCRPLSKVGCSLLSSSHTRANAPSLPDRPIQRAPCHQGWRRPKAVRQILNACFHHKQTQTGNEAHNAQCSHIETKISYDYSAQP